MTLFAEAGMTVRRAIASLGGLMPARRRPLLLLLAIVALGAIDAPYDFIGADVAMYAGLSYAYLLMMVFPLYNAIESLDHNQIEAARDLGAPWWHIHLFVVMPFAKPGIASGCTMVFMLTAGALVTVNVQPALLAIGVDGKPINFLFNTKTYDFDLSNISTIGTRHVLSYGGNIRHNSFDLSIAPNGTNRAEGGAYVQDEVFLSNAVRLNLGARVDKFGNIDKAVFSPRATVMFKPANDQSFRFSFNKAFRSPSATTGSRAG